MVSNRTSFVRVPDEYSNVSVLGSLVFDKRDILGPRALLDLSGVTTYVPLARDCIAALYEHVSPGRIASDFSLGGYGTAIRTLLEYCAVVALPFDFRMRDINVEFLLKYRAYLRVTRAEFKTDIHERAIEDGINAARALASLTVLPDDSITDAAEALGSTEVYAEKVLRGEQDVFFASCRDFYNKPGGESDMPCDKPWICLICSNAIITRHVLPRVLAFRDFMVQQRSELVSEDWNKKFGGAWQVLNKNVLPKFSAEALAEAERHVADTSLYIPLALRV